MFKINDRVLQLDQPFEIDGQQFPANWLRLSTLEDREKWGITVEDEIVRTFDSKFYFDFGIPRDIETVRGILRKEASDSLKYILADTDYIFIRKIENPDYEMPASIIEWRLECRAIAIKNKIRIEQAENIKDLSELVINQYPNKP